ncbi:MAG TPA: hypothetical protein VLF66_05340 [Thermoanaerobaculia bacterium]|nr:hypothetical protein [Thermoanaerobaculia bacterium]
MAEIPLGQPRFTEQKAKVIRMALTAKRMIRVLAFGLLAVFGFLKLKDVPLGSAIDSLPAELVFKIALIAYFFSWVLGTINDANEQEVAYAVPPEDGRFPWQGYAVGAVLAFVFGVMCYVRNPRHFVIALTFFLIINVLAWRYLLRKLLPEAYAGSRKLYRREEDIRSLFRLEVFYRYIAGKWQWYRFAFGAILLAPLYYLAFSPSVEGVAAALGIASKETLIALSFLIYVLSFEAWVWLERMKVKVLSGMFEDFSSEFQVIAVSAAVEETRG